MLGCYFTSRFELKDNKIFHDDISKEAPDQLPLKPHLKRTLIFCIQTACAKGNYKGSLINTLQETSAQLIRHLKGGFNYPGCERFVLHYILTGMEGIKGIRATALEFIPFIGSSSLLNLCPLHSLVFSLNRITGNL